MRRLQKFIESNPWPSHPPIAPPDVWLIGPDQVAPVLATHANARDMIRDGWCVTTPPPPKKKVAPPLPVEPEAAPIAPLPAEPTPPPANDGDPARNRALRAVERAERGA